MKFIINLFPYFAKNNPVLYSWVGALAVMRFGPENVILIGSEVQLKPPSQQKHHRWIKDSVSQCSDELWQKTEKILVPNSIVGHDLYDLYGNGLDYFIKVTSTVIDSYKAFLEEELIKRVSNFDDIIAIQHVNDITFKSACHSLKINVMHHEAGPIRLPDFKFGTYFADFEGINGAHSFDKIIIETNKSFPDLPLISLDSICRELYGNKINWNGGYEIGVCNQVEDDSNILCYSNGFTSISLQYKALWLFPSDKVLVRDHPLSHYKYNSGVIGKNNSDVEVVTIKDFIGSCLRVFTINSSVAFEFIINGRETYFFGEGPYKIMASNIVDRHLSVYHGPSLDRLTYMVNVFLFIYIIPEDFWLNAEYLHFRNKMPSIRDVYRYHVDYYKKKGYFCNL
jgi:hypothetical protein